MAQEVASLSESGFYALTRYSYLILIKAGRVFLKERRDVFMITLFDDYPIIVDRVLAQKIGLNESLFIQQLHYWTKINASANRNYYDSYYWTYNTYEAWHEQFPFWSLSTLKRLIKGLEKKGYIIVGNYNKIKIDKTKWYRINYEALGIPEKSPKCQNDPSRVSNWSVEQVNMNQAIPNTSSETTTENK